MKTLTSQAGTDAWSSITPASHLYFRPAVSAFGVST